MPSIHPFVLTQRSPRRLIDHSKPIVYSLGLTASHTFKLPCCIGWDGCGGGHPLRPWRVQPGHKLGLCVCCSCLYLPCCAGGVKTITSSLQAGEKGLVMWAVLLVLQSMQILLRMLLLLELHLVSIQLLLLHLRVQKRSRWMLLRQWLAMWRRRGLRSMRWSMHNL